jgi:hypothetical protein
VQPYNDPHPARAAEIEECLRRNAQNPHVTGLHVLLEPGTFVPQDVERNPRVTVLRNVPRLTFANAFAYATAHLPAEATLAVANSDIYLADDVDWEREATNGQAQCLTRFEVHPDGTAALALAQFVLGCGQDTWILPVAKAHLVQDCDFRVGNCLDCDPVIAERFLRAGLQPLNEACRLRTYTLDRCAHRNRDKWCQFSEGSVNVEATDRALNERQGGRASGWVHLRVMRNTHNPGAPVPLCTNARGTVPDDGLVSAMRRLQWPFDAANNALCVVKGFSQGRPVAINFTFSRPVNEANMRL